jgi:hypothetical protein
MSSAEITDNTSDDEEVVVLSVQQVQALVRPASKRDRDEVDISGDDDAAVALSVEESHPLVRSASKRDRDAVDIALGMYLSKMFEDGKYYAGRIAAGPEHIKDEKGRLCLMWTVHYEDGANEDLTPDEIKEWLIEDPRQTEADEADSKPKARPSAASPPSKYCTYEAAKAALCAMPGLSKDEVIASLDAMIGPPYGLQAALSAVHKSRDKVCDDAESEGRKHFEPHVGMEVRKMMGGWTYYGKVTGDREPDQDGATRWEVTFEDGEGASREDMTWSELLLSRANRSSRFDPVLGRQLVMLELFSGCGMVSQEFAELKWKVRSVDSSFDSYATDKVSIMDIPVPGIDDTYTKSGKGLDSLFDLLEHFVPDFIWASPPCFTYSLLAGGKHRNCALGLLEKTPEAHENNHFFVRMAQIMQWAKNKNPHLIVVIENPVGLLSKMPLMKELVENFRLYQTRVDYCAFGRDDKKPTHLWTNDVGLHSTLLPYKCCPTKCRWSKKEQVHPYGVRQSGHIYNAAAIPKALCELVAKYVDSKFFLDRIRHTKQH